MDKKQRLNKAYELLKNEGFNFKEDKVVFRLKEGALEIYFDEEEKTIKTEVHDMNVYVSDDLKDMENFDVLEALFLEGDE
ncbi:hypothetical protein [Staphylococcus hominis]|uniref:hypothetical protein n=1 Tax=Staphylococcus hominis TaxID=1290 RepID=UPI0007652B89|nr:hypothetical protein [Staphylococcus hominis]CVY55126.1 Uncharacterised protein [Staphylococcus hominis]